MAAENKVDMMESDELEFDEWEEEESGFEELM